MSLKLAAFSSDPYFHKLAAFSFDPYFPILIFSFMNHAICVKMRRLLYSASQRFG